MSKFDDVVAKAAEQLKKVGISADDTLLRAVAKSQGPSIYLRDASLVSCGDDAELKRVENNFIVKKLGVTDEKVIKGALESACATFKPEKFKMRVAFYYSIVKDLKKESVFA
jgi:hypothetical protein